MIRHIAQRRATPQAEAAYVSNANDLVDRSTYTFTGKSFGAAHPNRVIIVGCAHTMSPGEDSVLSSATIGGIAATVLVGSPASAAVRNSGYLIAARVPTGTSGTIAITWNKTANTCAMVAIRALHISSLTPTDSALVSDSSSTNVNKSININTTANCVAIGLTVGQEDVTWLAGMTATTKGVAGLMQVLGGINNQPGVNTPLAVTARHYGDAGDEIKYMSCTLTGGFS